MKYSINATNQHQIKDADEYKCPFNRLADIIHLIDTTKARLNIQYVPDTEDDFNILQQQIKVLRQRGIDFTVACKTLKDLDKVLNSAAPAYLDFPIAEWELLRNMINRGVSDIWIDGALCFTADGLKSLIADKDIRVRMTPHMSSSASFSPGGRTNAYSAFVRPEDTDLYENFIDIFDFKTDNKDTEKTLYNIYKRKYYNYNLQDLVKQLNYNYNINNALIPKRFAENRLNCQQKCQTPFSKCTICDRLFNLTHQLEVLFKKS